MLIEGDHFFLNAELISTDVYSDFKYEQSRVVYEVIRVQEGIPLFFLRHINRLKNSVQLLKATHPDYDAIILLINKLIAVNQLLNKNIRLSLIYKEDFDRNPDVLITFIPSKYPSIRDIQSGISVRSINACRETPNVKLENKNLRELADDLIRSGNCYEVILVDRNGCITEGSRSNIFFIQGNEVFTSPARTVLGGITREVVIEICENNGIRITEKGINVRDLPLLDGAFLTGTSPGVLPIAKFDNFSFQKGLKIQKKLVDEYTKFVEKDLNSFRNRDNNPIE